MHPFRKPFGNRLLSSCTSVYNCLTTRFVLSSTATDGGRIKQKRCFTFGKTRKSIYNTDVVNWRNSLLLITTDIPVRSVNARSVQKTPAGTVQNVHPCTFCTYVFALQTRYWREPPPSVASSKIDLLVNFWTRVFAVQKRRYCAEPRTSLSALIRWAFISA